MGVPGGAGRACICLPLELGSGGSIPLPSLPLLSLSSLGIQWDQCHLPREDCAQLGVRCLYGCLSDVCFMAGETTR